MTASPAATLGRPSATLDIDRGNYFEDLVGLFQRGEVIIHATPRTVTAGDVAVYNAVFGQRYAVTSDDEFARSLGFGKAPVPWMLLFHMGFGKTVPDVSQLAVANLGYADVRFLAHVYPGDSLAAETRVIGHKENVVIDKATGHSTSRGNGNVFVHSTIFRVSGNSAQPVVDYKRVVMVNKREPHSKAADDLEHPAAVVPELPEAVPDQVLCELAAAYPGAASAGSATGTGGGPSAAALAGGQRTWDDYEVGMRINHGERRQITSAHMELPNLTQNTAKVHFAEGRVDCDSSVVATGIVYGGHVMSMADAQAYYGLERTIGVIAINNGRHVAPCFEGESVAAWSVVQRKLAVPGRQDIGLLVVRTVAAKNMPAGGFPDKDAKGRYPLAPTTIAINGHKHSADAGVVLDYERVLVMMRGASRSKGHD